MPLAPGTRPPSPDAADRGPRKPIVVGLLAAGAGAHDLAVRISDDVAARLAARWEQVQWQTAVAPMGDADLSASSDELLRAARRCALARGWDLTVGFTELPLRAGRQPVTAHASATEGVGLVSIPALGAVGLARRLVSVVVNLIEGLLSEAVDRSGRGSEERRRARVAARLHELASPLGHARVHDDGSIRFLGAVLRGNLRLLVGMVRANQPSRVMLRLSRAMVAAIGAAAFALASSDVWRIAAGMTWPRLVALTVLSIGGTCGALVVAHGLWEQAGDPVVRERLFLFNIATTVTLGLGVLALYASLFALSAVGSLALISPAVLFQATHHATGVGDYLRLAWLVGSLAAIAGALGSLMETDLAVRQATYPSRQDERTETLTPP